MARMFAGFFSGTILDFSKRQNVLFWVSQIAIILSTVIGVYLATSEGLRSAVEFHSLTTLEKKYYTLNALRQEVDSNNEMLKQYVGQLLNKDENGTVVSHNGVGEMPDLNWFVWKTMENSSETLDLPVDILRDANRYYLNLSDLMDKLNTSGGYDTLRYGIALEKLTQTTKAEFIVRVEQQLKQYQDRLSAFKGLGKY